MALDGATVVPVADGGAVVDELLSLGCPGELLNAAPALSDSLKALLSDLGLLDGARSSQAAGLADAQIASTTQRAKAAGGNGWLQRRKNRRAHGKRR
jgi:hypothetical protein